jgi:hypothetical protein
MSGGTVRREETTTPTRLDPSGASPTPREADRQVLRIRDDGKRPEEGADPAAADVQTQKRRLRQRMRHLKRVVGSKRFARAEFLPHTFRVGDSRPDTSDLDGIERLFYEHHGRQIDKCAHYLAAYERFFAPIRAGFPTGDATRPLRFLEIGVKHGGSLQLWREYFGPQAQIVGIDVNPSCELAADPDVEVRIGSQADPGFLRGVVAEMGGVDVVLDDGSHHAKHQRVSFDVLFPLLSEGGLYIVEDAMCAYWYAYEGGLRRRGTFIEFAKQLVDAMHGSYYRPWRRPALDFARTDIQQISFRDGMVILEKGRRTSPEIVTLGTPSF